MEDKAINNTEIKEKIISVALDLAEGQGWEYTTLRDIADKSELSMSVLYEVIEDKNDILVLFGRMIDRKIMDGVETGTDDGLTIRERLFDILMDRYEILNEYRGGVIALMDSMALDPKQVVISFPHICRSMNWMLEASGVETSGVKGALKVAGLSGVYMKVLRTWKNDDTQDLAKTMAALDKALDRSESIADMLGF